MELTPDEMTMIHMLIMEYGEFTSKEAAEVAAEIERKLGAKKVTVVSHASRHQFHYSIVVEGFPNFYA